jgi:hypothetical protein
MISTSVARHRARAFRADRFDLSFGSPPACKARCMSTESASRESRPRRRSQSMKAPTAQRSSVASFSEPIEPDRDNLRDDF